MRIAERGQVTIPKTIREQCGFAPGVEVEFMIERGRVYLKKKSSAQRAAGWDKWVGHCAGAADATKHQSVDDYIDDVRGQ